MHSIYCAFYFYYFLIRTFEIFIYLLLAILGLHWCSTTFSNGRRQELLFVAGCGLLISVTSHCRAWALESVGFSCYSTQA